MWEDCKIVRLRYNLTIPFVFLLQVQILDFFKLNGDWLKLPLSSGRRTSTIMRFLHQISTDAEKLNPIKYWPVKIVFPPTHLFPPAKIVWDDPTCHVTPYRAAPVETTVPDKWVCGDEQLMEWLAKVMMLGESPFCCLISIWNNTTFCKCFLTSAKGQLSGTKIHHFFQVLPFFICQSWNASWFNLLLQVTVLKKERYLPVI